MAALYHGVQDAVAGNTGSVLRREGDGKGGKEAEDGAQLTSSIHIQIWMVKSLLWWLCWGH